MTSCQLTTSPTRGRTEPYLLVSSLLLGRRLPLLDRSVTALRRRFRRRLGLLGARLLRTLVRTGRTVPLAARYLGDRSAVREQRDDILSQTTHRGKLFS